MTKTVVRKKIVGTPTVVVLPASMKPKPKKEHDGPDFDGMVRSAKFSSKELALFPHEEDMLEELGLDSFQLPTGYLSSSQIDMFIRCPKQYEFRYLKGKKSPPGLALTEGNVHHDTLEDNNLHKMKTGKDRPVKDVVARFNDTFSKMAKEIDDWEGTSENAVRARGKQMLTSYMGGFALTIQPEAVEEPFVIPIGPLRVVGLIDLRAVKDRKKQTVVDYKTVNQVKTQKDVDNSLQLSNYAAVARSKGYKKPELGLCSLVKKTGKVDWKVFAGDVEARIRWMRMVSLSVAAQITKGNFPLVADPSHWSCSARFCGFWNECRGKVEACR